MENYTEKDWKIALSAIVSMISRSEKVQPKLKEGSSQSSLTKNRLKALLISQSLINKEMKHDATIENYSKEELTKALPPITSTILKCEKAMAKLKQGSPQLALTMNMLKALYLSSALITKELNR